jgi:hypothetical protein
MHCPEVAALGRDNKGKDVLLKWPKLLKLGHFIMAALLRMSKNLQSDSRTG